MENIVHRAESVRHCYLLNKKSPPVVIDNVRFCLGSEYNLECCIHDLTKLDSTPEWMVELYKLEGDRYFDCLESGHVDEGNLPPEFPRLLFRTIPSPDTSPELSKDDIRAFVSDWYEQHKLLMSSGEPKENAK